jgi:biopolymer transport protein TolQ
VEPSLDVYLAGVRATDDGFDLLGVLFDADPIVQSVLLVLVLMSVACWAIIALKVLRLQKAHASSVAFLDAFWQSRTLDELYQSAGQWAESPVAAVFRAGYKEWARVSKGGAAHDLAANVERSLRRATTVETTQLERFVPLLATTGSVAPFIGLFGTVWGILVAFFKLGKPGAVATLQVVGPDIAHALIATAVGLVAAIPAVIAYNLVTARVGVLVAEMENFSADFLNIVLKRRA